MVFLVLADHQCLDLRWSCCSCNLYLSSQPSWWCCCGQCFCSCWSLCIPSGWKAGIYWDTVALFPWHERVCHTGYYLLVTCFMVSLIFTLTGEVACPPGIFSTIGLFSTSFFNLPGGTNGSPTTNYFPILLQIFNLHRGLYKYLAILWSTVTFKMISQPYSTGPRVDDYLTSRAIVNLPSLPWG